MKKDKYFGYISGILFIFLIWIIGSAIINKKEIFPNLNQVLEAFIYLITKKHTYISLFSTFLRTFLVFLLSLVFALIIGTIANMNQHFKNFVRPLITSLRAIPTASLILFFLIVFGFSRTPYYLVFIITFPILYQSVVYGMEKIDKELLIMNKLDNYNNLLNFFKFTLPLSLPSIVNGMVMSFALAVKVEIMAEILTGSTKMIGIGTSLKYYKDNLETANLFAITILIIGLTIVLELIAKKIVKGLKYLEV